MAISRIAICGDGASAIALLTALAATARHTISVTVIGKGRRPGEGVAYSTHEPVHLLNVPAARMSLEPDKPDQFARWLDSKGIAQPRNWAEHFVSRGLYADYLHDSAISAAGRNPNLTVRFLNAEIISLVKSGPGWRVSHTGGTLDADTVVLATGNDMPTPLAARYGKAVAPLIIDDPWARLETGPDEKLLILGTGLTAVDAVLALAEREHKADVILLSRHGLLPATHHQPAERSPLPQPFPRTALDVARALRWAAGPASTPEIWQGLMDAMRPHWPEIWAGLPDAEKRRFLRHGATIWNMHRHRLAPQVSARLDGALARNVRIEKGRLTSVSRSGPRELTVVLHHRGRQTGLTVNRVINCMGPNSDPEKTHNRLIENIIASRQARSGAADVGLDVDACNRVIDQDGLPQSSLLAMGALTRGRWWEITAMPEIARQAASIAQHLAAYRHDDAAPLPPPKLRYQAF